MLSEIWRKAYGFLFHPALEFRKIRDEPLRNALLYTGLLFTVYACLALGIAIGRPVLFGSSGFHFPGLKELFFPALIFAGGVARFLFMIPWLHLWVYLSGGRRGVAQTIRAILYSQTPFFFLGWISLPWILNDLLLLLVGFWVLCILLIGIRELHDVTGTRAFVACILTALVLFLVFSILIIALSSPVPVSPSMQPVNWIAIPGI
jgi:hypothetical protein